MLVVIAAITCFITKFIRTGRCWVMGAVIMLASTLIADAQQSGSSFLLRNDDQTSVVAQPYIVVRSNPSRPNFRPRLSGDAAGISPQTSPKLMKHESSKPRFRVPTRGTLTSAPLPPQLKHIFGDGVLPPGPDNSPATDEKSTEHENSTYASTASGILPPQTGNDFTPAVSGASPRRFGEFGLTAQPTGAADRFDPRRATAETSTPLQPGASGPSNRGFVPPKIDPKLSSVRPPKPTEFTQPPLKDAGLPLPTAASSTKLPERRMPAQPLAAAGHRLPKPPQSARGFPSKATSLPVVGNNGFDTGKPPAPSANTPQSLAADSQNWPTPSQSNKPESAEPILRPNASTRPPVQAASFSASPQTIDSPGPQEASVRSSSRGDKTRPNNGFQSPALRPQQKREGTNSVASSASQPRNTLPNSRSFDNSVRRPQKPASIGFNKNKSSTPSVPIGSSSGSATFGDKSNFSTRSDATFGKSSGNSLRTSVISGQQSASVRRPIAAAPANRVAPANQVAASSPANTNVLKEEIEFANRQFSGLQGVPAGIQGTPVRMQQLLFEPLDPIRRKQMAGQYWETYYDLAALKIAKEYQSWLEAIAANSQVDRTLLSTAKQMADDRHLAAEIQLGKSQSRLLDYMPTPRGPGFVPVPADQPLIDQYVTDIEKYARIRPVPNSMRGIDTMLARTLTLITHRAKTADSAKQAADQATQSLRSRQSTVAATIAAGRLWRDARLDMVASAVNYNQAIADFVLTMEPTRPPQQQVVFMLGASQNQPGAAANRSVLQSTGVGQIR